MCTLQRRHGERHGAAGGVRHDRQGKPGRAGGHDDGGAKGGLVDARGIGGGHQAARRLVLPRQARRRGTSVRVMRSRGAARRGEATTRAHGHTLHGALTLPSRLRGGPPTVFRDARAATPSSPLARAASQRGSRRVQSRSSRGQAMPECTQARTRT